ncbi:MAG: cytochrome c biogenesis protein ResB [Acidobacteriia bacterium]|nr:cytochrome c biogenesis protein ResB [Terriglobia bacterium]
MAAKSSVGNRVFRTLASVKTGIILLIILGVVAAAGTLILQRPMTDADQMTRAYAPQTLRWLDRTGLTDVYHSWWFALLMAALGVSIVFASIDRFPKAWRLVSRPYRRPEPHFRAVLPMQRSLAISHAEAGITAAEKAFRNAGLKPQRTVENNQTAVYAEKNRWSPLAVYVVHASLLLILTGGIVDAFLGYKGYLMLTPGQSTSKLEQQNGVTRPLPFTLRCDGTGQENYPDGTPKKWWSKLTVIEDGRVVLRKEIVVNDPLVTHGIRFYQSGYGQTGEVESLLLNATAKGETRQITLRPYQAAQLDADTKVALAEFIPDFVMRDGQVYARSKDPVNPAIRLAITNTAKQAKSEVWLFPALHQQSGNSPFQFEFADLQMAAYTGLQVSHEPGQWLVWAGCVLMAVGLVMAFYLVHQRFWAIAVETKNGPALWIGTAADKNREHYEESFTKFVEDIRADLARQDEESVPAGKRLVQA